MLARPVVWMSLITVACCSAWGCGSGDANPPTVTASIAGGENGTAEPAAKSEARQAPQLDLLHPEVELQTSVGAIVLRLDAENAPCTVRNFLNYVNSAHYDGTIFHHVDAGNMILGGGFTSDYSPKPVDEPIRNEAHNGLKNQRGTIAMARDFETIDSATSQFFINLGENAALDYRSDEPSEYGYCVFGTVIAGMEVVDKIAQTPVEQRGEFASAPREAVVIKSARVVK